MTAISFDELKRASSRGQLSAAKAAVPATVLRGDGPATYSSTPAIGRRRGRPRKFREPENPFQRIAMLQAEIERLTAAYRLILEALAIADARPIRRGYFRP